MKLYLSSIGVPNIKALHDLLGKTSNITAASIRPGWDTYPEEKQTKWASDADMLFEKIGATAKIINLEEYRGKTAELKEALTDCDLIWIHGGNSFYISYWMKQCKFGAIMQELFKQGVVYGGESAGAVAACPNLHGIELADDPNDAPETVYEGLGLVDFAIVPHWGNQGFQPVLEKVKAESEKYNDEIVTIGDNECLVVQGDHMERSGRDAI